MKLSTRSTYGIRALVELALAGGRSPVSAALIAKRQDLSVAYLEQLLHRLKKQGLVTSTRGPRGGYVLARDAQRITMSEVVRVLDGDNGLSGGKGRNGARRIVVHTTAAAREAHRHAQRIALVVRQCVHERIAQSLAAVTLHDLYEEVRSKAGEPLDHRYVFHI